MITLIVAQSVNLETMGLHVQIPVETSAPNVLDMITVQSALQEGTDKTVQYPVEEIVSRVLTSTTVPHAFQESMVVYVKTIADLNVQHVRILIVALSVYKVDTVINAKFLVKVAADYVVQMNMADIFALNVNPADMATIAKIAVRTDAETICVTKVMAIALEGALIAFTQHRTKDTAILAILHALNVVIITTVQNAYQVDMAHFVNINVQDAEMVSVTKKPENVHWAAMIFSIYVQAAACAVRIIV